MYDNEICNLVGMYCMSSTLCKYSPAAFILLVRPYGPLLLSFFYSSLSHFYTLIGTFSTASEEGSEESEAFGRRQFFYEGDSDEPLRYWLARQNKHGIRGKVLIGWNDFLLSYSPLDWSILWPGRGILSLCILCSTLWGESVRFQSTAVAFIHFF